MHVTLTIEKALEVTRALQLARERLEICNYEDDEVEPIETIDAALARMYALPGVRDAIDSE